MVTRGEGPVNDRLGRANKECPYWQKVKRQFTFLNKVRRVLGELQDIVDDMDPNFDPTAYYTDPDESRLCVLGEIMADAAYLLDAGESEEADDRLRSAGDAAQEAFAALLDAGLNCCKEAATAFHEVSEQQEEGEQIEMSASKED
jgi:hypothetical protein